MIHKIETRYGLLKTATTHPYVIAGAHRTYAEGAFAYGEVFAFGYAKTVEAARKRIRRAAFEGVGLALYEVATGREVA